MLEDNLFELRDMLRAGTYTHSGYHEFYVTDPKLRHIHKPVVRDRVLHHALVRLMEPMFEPRFIFDSYSSRKDKGTHAAIARLREFAWEASEHNERVVWILKCDIRKFFDSVDHGRLLAILKKRIHNERFVALLEQVVASFETRPGTGIPLGNLTSQLFSNVYLDRLDQFMKRELRVRYYLRYADDFAIISQDRAYLESLLPRIKEFLRERLGLELHERKVIFRRWRQGVDFLGYVSFPHHTLLRSRTKKRMLKKVQYRLYQYGKGAIGEEQLEHSLGSFTGILRHCQGREIYDQLDALVEASSSINPVVHGTKNGH